MNDDFDEKVFKEGFLSFFKNTERIANALEKLASFELQRAGSLAIFKAAGIETNFVDLSEEEMETIQALRDGTAGVVMNSGDSSLEPIPPDIIAKASGNFVDRNTGQMMDEAFRKRWSHRRKEFPKV